jgi:hypothetical protein
MERYSTRDEANCGRERIVSAIRHELQHVKKITVEMIREFTLQSVGKEQMMDKAAESLVGEMSIMDRSGHKQVKWNTDKLDEIAVAKDTFDTLVKEGYSAFGSKTKMEAKHTIKEFDPTMEELVMVPKVVGG